MERIKHTFETNARILKSKVSKFAFIGLGISLTAILLATMAVAYQMSEIITLDSIIHAQKHNVALWMLDISPILFMFWGQSISTVMSYTASAMVMDQTNELRMQTNELTSRSEHESSHDSLTDLPNRVLFIDRLNQAINSLRGKKGLISVIAINIDNFKDLNSGFGNYNADRLLKQFAQRLKSTVEDPITVARFGGDDFAVLCPSLETHEQAYLLTKKLQKAVAIHFVLDDVIIDISATAGITFYPEHGKDADTLLQRANLAIYNAKQAGKDFAVYNTSMDKASPNRLILMSELKKAIDGEQLLVHYQPKIDLATGKISGCEALLRWEHPTFGMMSAEKFIPIAERTGLIKELSLYVLKQAIEQISKWRNNGIHIEVAINLSAVDIIDIELPYNIESLLNVYDLPPRYVTIEIIESASLNDQSRAIEVINRLASLGVKIAIDDFGTGYSSFVYLTNLPINEIKIDKSFILAINENEKKRNTVDAIIKLASALKLTVVAEGVEKESQMSILQSLNCHKGQGFYFSKALKAEEIEKLVMAEEQFPIETQSNAPKPKKIHIFPTSESKAAKE
ncbi:putative bifunctional diguanylate cyclase/phosphodiesterase [Legionella waltersii]|uniref:Regulatory protein (GGDEF and EAL domains) n=1 Tax=Legionella waltersii TaxID=66969 RepID=A0A0W1A029_9GAMM|nr:bifunctional diguanylate cyclase/phosphodiesterase [Legionella waltersii]KTD74722.1 regulatory protein (GGDEF and EAL domains) [Legionella waltersii]SNV00071.1 regulatory protein (GGDEF and EAL domains) [Legionella waltersii]